MALYHGPHPYFKMEEKHMKENHKKGAEDFYGMGLEELEAEISRSLKRANMRQLCLILRAVRVIAA